jgi:dsRNA-specific ribonuclease
MLNRKFQFFKCTKRLYSRWNYDEADSSFVEVTNKLSFKSQSIDTKSTILPKILDKNIFKLIHNPKINYEKFKKLEFLGDSYIEFIVSVFLFQRFPAFNKTLLVEKLRAIVNNKNLSDLSHKIGLTESTLYLKSNADVLEAYFGGIALESGINTHYNKFSDNVWLNWKRTSLFFINNSSNVFDKREMLFTKNKFDSNLSITNIQCNDYEDPDRRIMQLKNNSLKDLKTLFYSNPDDYDKKIEIDRLQFLGNSALKFFLTKLYNDNLTTYSVGALSNMRDSSLRESKVLYLTDQYLKNPSYSRFYTIFNRRKNNTEPTLKSVYIKQYLGYIVATHYFDSLNMKNSKLFEIGWTECELLVKEIYYDYMVSRFKNKQFLNTVKN